MMNVIAMLKGECKKAMKQEKEGFAEMKERLLKVEPELERVQRKLKAKSLEIEQMQGEMDRFSDIESIKISLPS